MLIITFIALVLCSLGLILETTNGFSVHAITTQTTSVVKPYLASTVDTNVFAGQQQQQQLLNRVFLNQDDIRQQSESSSSFQLFSLFDNAHDISSSLISSSSSLLQSENSSGDGSNGLILPGIVLTIAIGTFVYANVFITPEIIEANEQMRMDTREIEVRKLIELVQKSHHLGEDEQQEGTTKNLEELRYPLEQAFGMTIEDYIVDVLENPNNTTVMPYVNADQDLAALLKPMAKT